MRPRYEPDPPLVDLYVRDPEDRPFDSTQRLKLLNAAITRAEARPGLLIAASSDVGRWPRDIGSTVTGMQC